MHWKQRIKLADYFKALYQMEDATLAWIDKHHNKVNLLLLCVAILIYLLNCYRLRIFTIDDAFISYRYAENLALGHGFSWNYDNIPVLGFSNYLLVILTAFCIKLGLNPLVFSKLINIGAGVVSVILIGYLLKELIGNKFKYYFVVSLLWAIVPAGWVHAMSGLETTLFTSLCVLSTYLYVCFLRHNKKYYYLYWLLPCLMLTILCRYEGVLISFGILIHQIYMLVVSETANITSLKKLSMFALPFAFLIGLLFWNNFYFGQPLPNTFYVKTTKAYIPNAYAIFQFLSFLSPYVILVLLNIKHMLNNRFTNYLLLQLIIFLLPFLFISQSMNYLFRFYYPIASLIIVLSMVSFLSWRQYNGNKYNSLFTVLVLMFLVAYPLSTYGDSRGFATEYGSDLNKCHVSIGKTFGEFEEYRNYTIAVVSDAGAIPYYSRWRVFDFCLNDVYTAKHGFDVGHFYQQCPEVIVMTFYTGTCPETINTMTKGELIDYLIEIQPVEVRDKILFHPNFKNYTLVTIYQSSASYYEYIFIRDDILLETPDLINELKNSSNYRFNVTEAK